MKTVVHLSDIHFGRVDEETIAPIVQRIQKIDPDVVVVSGDLTQRAREEQFIEARNFLEQLPAPQIIVPGNHDMPLYRFHERVLSPLRNYRKYITDDLDPFYVDDEIAIAGINTARPSALVNGRINRQQLELIVERMCELPNKVIKIIVTHHPLDMPANYHNRSLVGRATMAMRILARCGADVLLAGHWHISHTGDTRIRHSIANYAAIVVQAGTATSTRVRNQPNSFNVLRLEHPHITVERYRWDRKASEFVLFTSELFHKTEKGWRMEQKEPVEGYEKNTR